MAAARAACTACAVRAAPCAAEKLPGAAAALLLRRLCGAHALQGAHTLLRWVQAQQRWCTPWTRVRAQQRWLDGVIFPPLC
eukprot:1158808-Pelagomonas_calceolata.AAC.6